MFWSDVRYGGRLLRRNPGYALAAVLTIAIGIGANAAIFGIINSILFRPLGLSDPDRLVTLCETSPSLERRFCTVSPPNAEDWSASSETLEAIGIGRGWGHVLRTDGGVVGITGGIATAGLFRVMRFTPLQGRLFRPDEFGEQGRVVVLSYTAWMGRFGGAGDIIGRTMILDDQAYTVVGVLQRDARIPRLEDIELWTPLHFDPKDEENRDWRGFLAYGRLAESVTLDQAREEMALLANRLGTEFPESNRGWGIDVAPLHEAVVGSVRPVLFMFLGAVSLVLLIGCANVANLLLARAARRGRELAVRAALGASPARIARLLLTESLLLAVLGGAGGILLALWLVDAFVSFAPPGIPRLDEVSLDWRVFAIAGVLSLITTVLVGVLPAFHATRMNVSVTLKEGASRGATRNIRGLRDGLVVSQVSLAVMLLVGAGLLIQTFATLLRWDPGFDRSNLTTVWLLGSSGKYATGSDVVAVFGRASEEVRALPSVVDVGRASAGPVFGGTEASDFVIAGRPEPATGDQFVARWYDIDPGYMRTLGVPVVSGRYLGESDVQSASPVAVINKTMADRYWPGADPIGAQLSIDGWTPTIVGVVGDVRPFLAGTPPEPEIYWPQHQRPRFATYLVIRTAADAGRVVSIIRERLRAVDPDMLVSGFSTFDERIAGRVVGPRFRMLLIGSFAGIALLLAAVGVYGVMAYSVSERVREIGIRVAVGARHTDILRSVVGHGLAISSLGVLLGLTGALLLGRFLSSVLFGVSTTNPATYVVVALVVLGVGTVACYLPARRAARIDAVVALQSE